MKLRTRIQTLVAASMLALVAVSLSVGQADAKPKKPVDNGVRCLLRGENVVDNEVDDFMFYLPGETAMVVLPDGRTAVVRCGEDGQWHPARVAPTGGQHVAAPQGSFAP